MFIAINELSKKYQLRKYLKGFIEMVQEKLSFLHRLTESKQCKLSDHSLCCNYSLVSAFTAQKQPQTVCRQMSKVMIQ